MSTTLDRESLLREISVDRSLASSLLFRHRHPQDTPPFHIQIVDVWRSAEEFVVVEAFREAAKSTLSEEFLLIEACFGNFKYALIFGETWTKACQRLAAIKHEALTNASLGRLFGKLKGPVWSDDTIVLTNGVRLEAHGWEEEIRGYKWLDARPDRAYLDDIENQSMVRDTAAVDATWRKLNTQLIPALDTMRRKVRLTGTPLADDCVINRCKASAEWTVASFPICTAPDGATGAAAVEHPGAVSMWPARYPMTWIRKEMARMASSGLLREFVQEYMLIAATTQGKPFVEEELRYEDVAPPALAYSPRVLIVDPARTTVVGKSDRTGRVVVSRLGTRLYVHESSGEYWKPDAVVADLFDTSARHDDCEVAIERNSLDEWLMQPIRAEMLRRGRVLDLQAVLAPPDRSKEQFILGLQPFFKAGDVVLLGGRSKHAQLVSEVLNFPSGKRDILNALAYAQRVFGGDPVYSEFSAENVTSMFEPAQGSALCLGMHATSSEFCAVLLDVDGRHMTVLHDFTSSLAPVDAMKDVMTLMRAGYPNRRMQFWVPADDYEQQGRIALMDAARRLKVTVHQGGYVAQSRGCLADALRTTLDRKRLLRVDSTCKVTLRALASGYRQAVGSNGRTGGEPEKNVSRTLMEALETMAHAITAGAALGELPSGFGSSMNAQGQGYLSAVRR